MAPPKSTTKSKAQDLERIRANQQRSRDRRKAYISELEERVRLLSEKLKRESPCEKVEGEVSRENEARRELLKALGVNEGAQEQFVRAFVRRDEVMQAGVKVQEGRGDRMVGRESAPRKSNNAASEGWTTEASPSWQSAEDIVAPPAGGSLDDTKDRSERQSLMATVPTENAMSLVRPVTRSQEQPLPTIQQTPSTLPLTPPDQQAVFTPCLWNTCGQVSASSSESTTGCSIAFSMLLSNNSRGYTFADIDARLQAAYRQDASVAEGCSVPTKVLFQLLSEIS